MKNKEDFKLKVVSMSIQEAAKKWPDSRSKAFQVEGSEDNYYFILSKPQMIGTATIRSRVKCLKFIQLEGKLLETTLTIKTTMGIIPITFKKFVDVVLKKYDEIVENPKYANLLSVYIYWGLTRDKDDFTTKKNTINN